MLYYTHVQKGKVSFLPLDSVVGLCLWIFCPNVLAWSGIATVDMGATVAGLATMYTLRHYLHHPSLFTALGTGGMLGLALLSKFTLLMLVPLFSLLWLIAWLRTWHSPDSSQTAIRWSRFALVLAVSMLVFNMGYGFQGIGRPLGSFSFRCHALTRAVDGTRINRFQNTCLERLPTPLPAAFLVGLDVQKSHADLTLPAYFRGQWQHGGWWYYYLYGLGVKLPLGTLALIALCAPLLAVARYRRGPIEELLVWLPAGAILLLISSQAGINGHLRYVLPLFPFLFIGISRVGLLLADVRGRMGAAATCTVSARGRFRRCCVGLERLRRCPYPSALSVLFQ
jgi:hypothetical protein